MASLIQAYLKNDPAARSGVEVLLLYPGVKALGLHRIAHRLRSWGVPFIPRAISEFSRWITGIEIHPGARIGKRLVIDHGMGIVIGETAEIGDDCVIYHGVTLGGVANVRAKRHPTIGDRVLIGARATLLGDIQIGNDSRIGANSLVLADVSPATTVTGLHRGNVSEKGSPSI